MARKHLTADRQEQFDRILAFLYEVVLDDSLWSSAAVLIDEAVGIRNNQLVVAEGLKEYAT